MNQLTALLVSYLSPSPGPDTSAVSYAHLRKVHIVGATTDAFNTSMILWNASIVRGIDAQM